jgi:transposase
MALRVEVVLSDEEREVLERWARRPKSSQALALRCRIVLAAADGEPSKEIAGRLSCSPTTVGKWRGRFARRGLDGLHDEPRPGKPRSIGDEDVERVIVKTLEEQPPNATHWSTRQMAAATGLSQTAISRIWRAFGLKPHQSETFKLSPGGCPGRRGTLVTARVWLSDGDERSGLLAGVCCGGLGDLCFDCERGLGEVCVADDPAELALGLKHPGGGPSEAHLA